MDILKNNWKLKLISIIIAIFLWSYVIALENPTVSKQYKGLEVVVQEDEKLTSEGYEIVGQTPETIDLKIVGKRNALTDANIKNIYAYVELGDVTEGPNSKEIKYQIPRNISIEDSSATYITFQIEKVITKEVSVTVEYENEIGDEYVVGDVVSSPKKITVQGIRSRVDSIDRLVATVNLEGVETDQMVNVNLKALDVDGNEVSGITLGQSFVNVTMQVNKIKEIPIEVLTTNEAPSDVKIKDVTVEPNSVLVVGKRDVVDKIKSVATESIDLENIRSLDNTPVSLELPEGISLYNEDTEYKIKANMEELTTRKIDVPIEKIEMRNLRSGLKATITNPTDKVTLELEGFSSDIGDFTVDDVKVFIDLKDLGVGSNRVSLQASLGEKGKVKSINPLAVSVEIKE